MTVFLEAHVVGPQPWGHFLYCAGTAMTITGLYVISVV